MHLLQRFLLMGLCLICVNAVAGTYSQPTLPKGTSCQYMPFDRVDRFVRHTQIHNRFWVEADQVLTIRRPDRLSLTDLVLYAPPKNQIVKPQKINDYTWQYVIKKPKAGYFYSLGGRLKQPGFGLELCSKPI